MFLSSAAEKLKAIVALEEFIIVNYMMGSLLWFS
jgi:hypothetical protein